MNINKSLSVIILAAGKGKRMNNPDIPKVMSLLDNQPLIHYVLNTVFELNPDKIALVIGHKKQILIDYVNQHFPTNIEFVEQLEQLGTGHAVAQAETTFANDNTNILILAGDVPLITAQTLQKFLDFHFNNNADISVLSTITNQPKGYGRIVRNSDFSFSKIVEEKDANEAEKAIQEINSGIYFVNSQKLFNYLKQVKNENAQAEYYLTDIIELMKNNNESVFADSSANFFELQGINTIDDLKKAENYYLSNS